MSILFEGSLIRIPVWFRDSVEAQVSLLNAQISLTGESKEFQQEELLTMKPQIAIALIETAGELPALDPSGFDCDLFFNKFHQRLCQAFYAKFGAQHGTMSLPLSFGFWDTRVRKKLS